MAPTLWDPRGPVHPGKQAPIPLWGCVPAPEAQPGSPIAPRGALTRLRKGNQTRGQATRLDARARIGGYLAPIPRVARATATRAHASAQRWGETWTQSIKIPRPLATLGGRAYPQGCPGMHLGGPWVRSLGPPSPISPLHTHKQKKRKLLLAPHCTPRLPHPSAGGNARGPEIAGQPDMQEPGDGDYCWPTAHELLGQRHPGPRLSHMAGRGWGLKHRDSQIPVRGA